MEVVIGERDSGRTTKLIELVKQDQEHRLLVVRDGVRVTDISKQHGIMVVTYQNLYENLINSSRSKLTGELYIDDLDEFFKFLYRKMTGTIAGFSICNNGNTVHYMNPVLGLETTIEGTTKLKEDTLNPRVQKEYNTLTDIVEQLESCDFRDGFSGSPIDLNVAFITLKAMTEKELNKDNGMANTLTSTGNDLECHYVNSDNVFYTPPKKYNFIIENKKTDSCLISDLLITVNYNGKDYIFENCNIIANKKEYKVVASYIYKDLTVAKFPKKDCSYIIKYPEKE